MNCFICGKDEADFFKLEQGQKIFENIDKAIIILKNKGKVFKEKIKNGDNESKHLGTELSRGNKEIKELKQQKEKLEMNDFFDIVFVELLRMDEYKNDTQKMMKQYIKYLNKNLSAKSKINICMSCNAICNSILNEKYSRHFA